MHFFIYTGCLRSKRNLYCNSRTSVLGRLRDYLRLLMKRSVEHFDIANVRSFSPGKHTVCPRRSRDPFYIVAYYIKWVTTSRTYSICGAAGGADGRRVYNQKIMRFLSILPRFIWNFPPFNLFPCTFVLYRDEDPDPVGSVDFWPAGSGTFFIGSGSYL